MCKPKPGPRCSGHATQTLSKLSEQIPAAMGNPRALEKLTSQIAHTSYDLWGTPAGADQLQQHLPANAGYSDRELLATKLRVGATLRERRAEAAHIATQLDDPTDRATYAALVEDELYQRADHQFATDAKLNRRPADTLALDEAVRARRQFCREHNLPADMTTCDGQRQCPSCGQFVGFQHDCPLDERAAAAGGLLGVENRARAKGDTLQVYIHDATYPHLAALRMNNTPDGPLTASGVLAPAQSIPSPRNYTQLQERRRAAADTAAHTLIDPDEALRIRTDNLRELFDRVDTTHDRRAVLRYVFPAATPEQRDLLIGAYNDTYDNPLDDPFSKTVETLSATNPTVTPSHTCPGCELHDTGPEHSCRVSDQIVYQNAATSIVSSIRHGQDDKLSTAIDRATFPANAIYTDTTAKQLGVELARAETVYFTPEQLADARTSERNHTGLFGTYSRDEVARVRAAALTELCDNTTYSNDGDKQAVLRFALPHCTETQLRTLTQWDRTNDPDGFVEYVATLEDGPQLT